MVLTDLNDLTVSAVSRTALIRPGFPAASAVGRPALELVRGVDRDGLAAALEAMRTGVINSYHAHRRLPGPTGVPESAVTVWARAVRFDRGLFSFTQLAFEREPRRSPLAEHFGHEPVEMPVGAADAGWVIRCVSSDITTLLGLTEKEMVGRSLLEAVDDRDVHSSLLDADRWAAEESSVSLGIRLRDARGDWKHLRCVLTPVAGATGRFFMVVPDAEVAVDASADRAARLEQHLRRIAAEVEASRILAHVERMTDPGRSSPTRPLSSRQLEVLSRLLRGERVPTIAAELFVSRSTVRNHLSAIFERFGVHSQAQLLATLAAHEEDPSFRG
jgi:DNA-binding CsgD family transcriptional regulator